MNANLNALENGQHYYSWAHRVLQLVVYFLDM